MTDMTLQEALAIVNASNDHKVSDRLPIIAQYNTPPEGVPLKTFVALDTETTGLDKRSDKIIEVSLIAFTYDENGVIYDVTDLYSGLEDPLEPLSAEVIETTGIQDNDLAGQSIDKQRVRDILKKADLIGAHNAEFDREFIDRTFGTDYSGIWTCSMKDPDWKGEKIHSRALSVLLAHYGFFFDAHRAETDVRATIHLLSMGDRAGAPHLKSLIDAATKKTYEVWAFDTGFHTKDILKEKGYWWHAGDDTHKKSWHKPVDDLNELRGELDFLNDNVTPLNKSSFMVEERGPELRFTDSKGKMMQARLIYDVLTKSVENEGAAGPR